MKDPDDPTSPGHLAHEPAIEWLSELRVVGEKAKAKQRWTEHWKWVIGIVIVLVLGVGALVK